jgi:hypothetical protein
MSLRNKIETNASISLEQFSQVKNVMDNQNELGNAPFYTWQELASAIESLGADYDVSQLDAVKIATLVLFRANQ